MDANNKLQRNATVQGYDQWGNLQCVYVVWWHSRYGCIYQDGFGVFNEGFDAAACTSYGGVPCGESSGDVSGCTDQSLTIMEQQQ